MTGSRICPRCGTFAELRSWAGRDWCEPCYGRVRPAEAGEASTGVVAARTWQVYLRIALPAGLVFLMFSTPLLATELLPNAPVWFLFALAAWIVQALGWVAVLHLGLQAQLSDEPVRLGPALRRVVEMGGWLLVVRFLCNLMIFFFSLACVVPGIYKAMSLFIAEAAIVADAGEPGHALDLSTKQMKGHRLSVFALAWVVWLVPLLIVIGLSAAGELHAMETGTNHLLLPATIVTWLLAVVLAIPLGALQAATYLLLAPAPSWGVTNEAETDATSTGSPRAASPPPPRSTAPPG
jgi:hypothetical protein